MSATDLLHGVFVARENIPEEDGEEVFVATSKNSLVVEEEIEIELEVGPGAMEGVDGRPGSSTASPDLDDLSLEKLYEYFSHASTLADVTYSFSCLKERLGLTNLRGFQLFSALKQGLKSSAWKALDLFKLLEKRAIQRVYMDQTAGKGVRVLVIGSGPVGMRTAIECVLLGCEVLVVEKRKSFSRNNVLHLWPFTIEDLKMLGAKKFYGKFCAGAIDHISKNCLFFFLIGGEGRKKRGREREREGGREERERGGEGGSDSVT